MKKVAALFAILCVMGISAQRISASPFEGRWVWDGADASEVTEVVFFGNIVLVLEDFLPYYMGSPFTHSGGIISVEEFDIEWRYRLSGNTLHLSIEDGESVSFMRVPMPRSPIEGFWQVMEAENQEADDEQHVFFTGDIMGISEDDGYLGFTIEFKGRAFRPSVSSLADTLYFIPEDQKEEFLASLLMEYSLAGNYLTLTHQGETIRLQRMR